VAGLQESAVQASLSLQLTAVCAHPVTGSQESAVQASLSSHDTGVVVHPVAGLQESAVQASLSLQLTAVCAHPVTGSQESAVQALLSLQFTHAAPEVPHAVVDVPTTQNPPLSQPVHVWTQPPAEHESKVKALPSLQSRAVPAHDPPLQTSLTVQEFPSSQLSVLRACEQPAAESQLSVVQGLLSSQFVGVERLQVPPLQRSPVVQALPSSQLSALFVCVQLPPRQPSVVQGFVSSQAAAFTHSMHAPTTQ